MPDEGVNECMGGLIKEWMPKDRPETFTRMLCADGFINVAYMRAALNAIELWCRQNGYKDPVSTQPETFTVDGVEYCNERKNKRLLTFHKL